MAALRDREPVVTSAELDEDVGEIEYSLGQYYRDRADRPAARCRPGSTARCARSSRTWAVRRHVAGRAARAARDALIRRLEPELLANVFRWTGHFPGADPGAAPLPGRPGRSNCGRATLPDAGGRGDRRADDAGDGAGDEPRAAGELPAVERSGLPLLQRAHFFPFLLASARFTIRSISLGIVQPRRRRPPWRTRSIFSR